MLGDREKCIQAQMDVRLPLTTCERYIDTSQEYLSKPLKQNQLIQTILKCATIGNALLERNNQHMAVISSELDHASKNAHPAGESSESGGGALQRPTLEVRALTQSGHQGDSPQIVTSDQADPFERVRAFSMCL